MQSLIRMHTFILVLFLSVFSACLAEQKASGEKSNVPINNVTNDDPVINGITVTAPITEVNPPAPTTTPVSPHPTTVTTTPSTTPSSNITTQPTTPATTSKTTVTTPKSTTTPPSTTSKTTTVHPSSTTAPITSTAEPQHDRKFDGPSFLGGIILALGLVAIGFVAFKFYKARTELNYHTL